MTTYDSPVIEKIAVWLDNVIDASNETVSRELPFTDQSLCVAFVQRRTATSLSLVLDDGSTYILSVERKEDV